MATPSESRNRFLIKSSPNLSLSYSLPSKLVPLPIFKRHISFLKEVNSEEFQTREPSDIPHFSGKFSMNRGPYLQEREIYGQKLQLYVRAVGVYYGQ